MHERLAPGPRPSTVSTPRLSYRRRLARRWADVALHTKALLVVALPIVMLILAALSAAVLERKEHESNQAVARAHQGRVNVLVVYLALLDAETGVRGYVLTRDEAFLAPFRLAEERAPDALRRLKETATDPVRRAHVEQLTPQIENRIRQWKDLLSRPVQPTVDLPARLRAGKASMDQIRDTLTRMLAVETRDIAEQTAARDRLLRRSRWLVGSSVVAGVGGGLLVAWLFVANVVRRVQRIEGDARRLAQGQPLRASGETSRDAIGRLDTALRDASGLLLEREGALRLAAGEIMDLYENAPCGYHSVDSNGTLLRMNATELDWLGYRADEIIGTRRFVDLISPESKVVFEEVFPEFKRTGRVTDMEFELVRKDGTLLPVSLSASAIRDQDGNFVASRSTVFDVSVRRKAEREVAALNEELQLRLADQSALNRELEAFSYSVSHDLRAPLRSIDGFAQALVEDCHDSLPEDGRGHLIRIRSAAQRMGGLIDDMLTLARVSRTELRRTRVDVSGLAEAAAARCAEQDPARAVEWRIEPGLYAFGDRQLLEAAIENLVGNAWKFTLRTERPVITVGAATAGPGYAGFVVRDNGAGFDMRYAGKLFTAFQRLHTAAEFSGTGIGLATVQRIVAKHGGRVWAHAAPDAGAAFFIVLPVEGGGAASAASSN